MQKYWFVESVMLTLAAQWNEGGLGQSTKTQWFSEKFLLVIDSTRWPYLTVSFIFWGRYIWESKADGAFAISEDTENEPLGRGTEIRLHLKEEASEYLQEDKLKVC